VDHERPRQWAWRASARGHWCSPAMAEEDERDEAMPERCSMEHMQQRRGDATTAKAARAWHECGGGWERAQERGG
jgi:hypothetical protein